MGEVANMTAEAQAGALQVLTFDLHGETFALEAGLVQEVLDLTPETGVPGAAPFVAAVINFRGRVIPLADLRLAFGLERGETTLDSRIVVIEHNLDGEPALIGLRADKVHEVTSIEIADTEDAPRVGLRWRTDFIRCLARRGDDLIVVPDLEQIFETRGGARGAVVHLTQS
ncbi:MAG: chemotaxis protein CheW [Phenylobacterium sp.]|uniref:chemotaxis protein CheW n=1 Tax=Phenylobacterium sp. TaxID=1871053 RepID=UPI0025D5902B|nr:chemotaxis protein CheW [Phenylobacterium sp.]MBI1199724.1 chemotaxis protein CheW [Phenylobacterium sp.]